MCGTSCLHLTINDYKVKISFYFYTPSPHFQKCWNMFKSLDLSLRGRSEKCKLATASKTFCILTVDCALKPKQLCLYHILGNCVICLVLLSVLGEILWSWFIQHTKVNWEWSQMGISFLKKDTQICTTNHHAFNYFVLKSFIISTGKQKLERRLS